MTFFELIRPLIPKHGDKLRAGNVEFWNDQGELCYDKPKNQWDADAVTRDISFNLCLLSITEKLAITNKLDEATTHETTQTSTAFAA